MLDIIGAISLTALFAVCSAVLLTTSPLESAARWRLMGAATAWFVSITTLAAIGVFSTPRYGTFAIGVAVVLPVLVLIVASARSASLRKLALETPLSALVAIHAGRILGVFFLLLLADGRLPATFASVAGWGDIGVALVAVPLAWAIHRRLSGSQPLAFAWNVLAFVDLLTAVTLGVGSAPDSPLRFIFESQHSGAIGSLPWTLIPAVLVPLYLLTHIAIFAQLARRLVTARHSQRGRRLAWESSVR
jgi:hypothetical protein